MSRSKKKKKIPKEGEAKYCVEFIGSLDAKNDVEQALQ